MNVPITLILTAALLAPMVIVWPLKQAHCGHCQQLTLCKHVAGVGLRCGPCRRRARLASIARRLLGSDPL